MDFKFMEMFKKEPKQIRESFKKWVAERGEPDKTTALIWFVCFDAGWREALKAKRKK